MSVPETIIRRAARLLSADAPNAALARLAGCPKSTARAWISGHRRPPINLYSRLEEEFRERIRTHFAIVAEMKHVVWLRGREPQPPLRGFFAIDPLTGRDKRNRLGRPKKTKPV
jgi:hypothetical protein